MVTEQEWAGKIRDIITRSPTLTRDQIIAALKVEFPDKADATLGERLSAFAEASEVGGNRVYVMRSTPRGRPGPGPSGPKRDELVQRQTAPPKTEAQVEASVKAESPTPVQVPRSMLEPGEGDAVPYGGDDERLFGSKWFRRKLSTDETQEAGSSEAWAVRLPDGTLWQFEVPTPKATDKYKPRKFGKKTDIEVMQTLLDDYLPMLAIGHLGAGKTTLVFAAAGDASWHVNKEARGHPWLRPRIYRAVMSNVSYEALIGQYVPNETGVGGPFIWQDGILTRMVRYGGIFIADEINLTPPEILVAFNSLLDTDRFIIIPQHGGEVVHAHARFRMTAAMNPSGYGYAGTKPLNAALKSRFSRIMWFNWSSDVEKKQFPPEADVPNSPGLKFEALHKMWADLRNQFRIGSLHYPPSNRDLINYTTNCRLFSVEDATSSFLLLYEDPKERPKALLTIRKYLPREFIPNLSLETSADLYS